jgi:hypothetical protein
MARRFTIEILMNLAKAIGANPNKFMGTKTNITFLGKGPQRNPLFQEPLAGLEGATEAQLGSRETMIEAVEDAMGYLSSGKLNSIQSEILGHNLSGIKNIYNPPPLPMASVTDIAPGIAGLKRFPRETQKFMGRPLKDKDFSEIDRMVMEGKIPDARGRTWDLKAPGTGTEAFLGAMDHKTGMSRAISRQILLQDKRLNLPETVIKSLFSRTDLGRVPGGMDPLDLMKKYYGRSMRNYDSWLDNLVVREGATSDELANLALKEIKLLPQFAEGGLAEILQAPRSGYSKGRIAKNVLSILNRNKKNADYMFKASDNVSPGYAKGDLKYNAELLADQLAEDAGVVYDDLGQLERTEFYGTAYDYLAKEMMQYRQMTKMLTDVEQKMQLSDFSIKGRKPSASGGLAGILEV